jgi:hypothetical protein
VIRSDPPLIDPEAVMAALDEDGEFRLAARFWTGSLGLRIGSTAWTLNLQDGRVATMGRSRGEEAEIRVEGPESEWLELLAAQPRPFYQDLWGATFRHGVRLEGDAASVAAYYGAIRRLIEVLRALQPQRDLALR